jgi:hypothetical protein
MDAAKTVAIGFSVIPGQILAEDSNGNILFGLPYLLEATQNITSNRTILIKADYSNLNPESLLFNSQYTVNLNGGLGANWQTSTGILSSVKGTLRVRSGKVAVNGVKLRN